MSNLAFGYEEKLRPPFLFSVYTSLMKNYKNIGEWMTMHAAWVYVIDPKSARDRGERGRGEGGWERVLGTPPDGEKVRASPLVVREESINMGNMLFLGEGI